MSSSTAEIALDVRAAKVRVTKGEVTVELIDGRTISVPLAWYPRLLRATDAERANFEIWDDGLFWPDLNADISFRAVLLGQRSGESPRSFRNWLKSRSRGEKEEIRSLPLPPRLARILKSKQQARKR
jgi:hypothetical protein